MSLGCNNTRSMLTANGASPSASISLDSNDGAVACDKLSGRAEQPDRLEIPHFFGLNPRVKQNGERENERGTTIDQGDDQGKK